MRTVRLRTLSVVFVLILGCLFWGAPGSAAQTGENPSDLQKICAGQSYKDLIQTVRSKQSAEKFVFVVLGDSRGNFDLASKIYKQAALENPAFILHTGDMVDHPTTEKFLQYHMPLVRLIAPVPLIPVPGNHEKGLVSGFEEFRAIYGGEEFSFDAGNCRFIGINNSGPDGLTEDGLRFLKQELARPGARNKFIIMHKPAAFMQKMTAKPGRKPKYRGFTERVDAFVQLMKEDKVQSVFFGHDHGFSGRNIDGVRYYITGGAGAELYSDFDWIESIHHYLVIHVDPDSVWQELVQLDGDRWVRSKLE
jgi:3',5'-cyclic AMP phosphodiesterase CpdA